LAAWLADRYKSDDAFLGIGLINEPAGTTDDTILHQFYLDAYNVIRATGNDCILAHEPLLYRQWPSEHADFMPGYNNVWTEWHKYTEWGFEGKTEDEIMYTAVDGISSDISQWTGNWMFIGEWALTTDTQSAPFNDRNKFKLFAQRFIDAVNKAHSGWTYWTWKCSYDEGGSDPWSLRSLMRAGEFPHQSTLSLGQASE
jgi:glucan 1,3-beta-glucosidase